MTTRKEIKYAFLIIPSFLIIFFSYFIYIALQGSSNLEKEKEEKTPTIFDLVKYGNHVVALEIDSTFSGYYIDEEPIYGHWKLVNTQILLLFKDSTNNLDTINIAYPENSILRGKPK